MSSLMLAMVMEGPGQPLVLRNLPLPVPAEGQVLVKVIACGVCRTDLHIIDGELAHPKLPLIPGHEIIGVVISGGPGAKLQPGALVGIPWLGYTCNTCKYCRSGRENLCEQAGFTGYTINGGYATHTVAWEQYCFPLPERYGNASGAPLLCAGLIGYRSYRMIHPAAQHIGIYGFGAAAHIITQVAAYEGKKIYAFTREGDLKGQQFAKETGAIWAGDSLQMPPQPLDAAIIFAPDGSLVPQALAATDKGGQVVCGGIHMSDIPSFPYSILWEERSICSVANLTREDGTRLLDIAGKVPVKTTTKMFELHQANEALDQLRKGAFEGAAVLVMPGQI
ncbi:alcohol dehydrogenase, propanol-preferring [Chitinophaga rupis]|uniref:Alcohol dehydrogenase, propanol-preferring n=1 Tax=Chitinophaga rupis TaxID=573321 RepID=A0A1H7Q076_9BACT|nr:zinc-dependent alcohol dehydrogenase family protein [Chitinophaga rupis]SEL40697.1 alcohol dehydrogenase, propanol-preferring [Chitinophaga rupis]